MAQSKLTARQEIEQCFSGIPSLLHQEMVQFETVARQRGLAMDDSVASAIAGDYNRNFSDAIALAEFCAKRARKVLEGERAYVVCQNYCS